MIVAVTDGNVVKQSPASVRVHMPVGTMAIGAIVSDAQLP